MSQTKYYMAFAASDKLDNSAKDLLERRAQGTQESYVPALEQTMEYFIPEMMDAFLVGTVDAVGLSKMSTKVVHSTADVLSKTARMIVPHLLKKRSNQELDPMVDFVDEVRIPEETTVKNKPYSGCEIDKPTHDKIQHVISEIRAGNGEQVRGELNEIMSLTVDILLEGLMKRAINQVKQGFVVRKITDGAIATCRAAGHGVVNKVFKKLEENQLIHLANYFDELVITAQR